MPTFDNSLKSLFIDGKEVIRASLDGKVFYEKKMCELTLTADKPIIMTGETTVLTAGLTCNRVPVAGEKVKFYIVEDVPAGLSFTGNEFSVSPTSQGLAGESIVIDWGDGTTTNYTGVSDLNHTYNVSGDYFITITGITSLGNSCFNRCSGLTSVVIPESVTSIAGTCFYNCTDLTSIIIPDSVTSLGNNCFYNCSGLTSVVIPESVTSLGNGCFYNCSGLTSLVCNWESNPPAYNSTWITGASSSLKFSIPYGTTSVYTAKGYPSDKLEERSG